MGDMGEPGNAVSAVRIANAMVRPDTVDCTCGAGKRGTAIPHAEECLKGQAWSRWREIYQRHTSR